MSSEANRKLEIFYTSNDKSIKEFWLQILNSVAKEQLQIMSTKNHCNT